MNNNVFDQIDFGHLKPYLADDDITDISYDNGGQNTFKKHYLKEYLELKIRLLMMHLWKS